MSEQYLRTLTASLFQPTGALAGSPSSTIFRGLNMILRGFAENAEGANPYFEVFGGNLNLNENYDLTGAGFKLTGQLTWSANNAVIQGAGTLFKEELALNMLLQAASGEIFSVKEITDNTHFTCWRAPTAGASAKDAYRHPQLSEMRGKRAVQLAGNPVETARGNIVSVGLGELFVNGQPLAGTSLIAKKQAQTAIFRPATNDYEIRNLGYASPPPAPVISVVPGGVKGMPDKFKYSIMCSYWSGDPDGTDGFSDPCDVIKLDGAAAAIMINGANNQLEADFTTSLVGMPSNARGFILWGSLGGKKSLGTTTASAVVTTTSSNEGNYDTGPWYKITEVPTYSTTFLPAAVNTVTDQINIPNHHLNTGDRVYISSTTTAPTFATLVTAGAPILSTTPAYVIRVDENFIKLAVSKSLANAGTADNITAAGVGTHTISFLETGDKFKFEYLDADLGVVVTGDNTSPPDADYLAMVGGRPMFISCFGPGKVANSEGTSPGKFCAVSKYNNPDGVPRPWVKALEAKNTIVGWFEGPGRQFIMTRSTLDMAVNTTLLGQQFGVGQNIELPALILPYWKTGAANRYSITIVDDTLYGRSGGKMFQSIGNGDESPKRYDFGAPIADTVRVWNDGHVYAVHDSKNNCVNFINTAAFKNADGYWCSIIQPYSLYRTLGWMPGILLSASDRDMIISGVSVINERFEFLCGGRVGSGGTFQTRTYRYDEDDPANPVASMPWYLVWQPSDDQEKRKAKQVMWVQPSGKFTKANVQIHGATPGGDLIIADIEAGVNYKGKIFFSDVTEFHRYLGKPMKVGNLGSYAVRIEGEWNGVGMKDRLDELVVAVKTHGRNR